MKHGPELLLILALVGLALSWNARRHAVLVSWTPASIEERR